MNTEEREKKIKEKLDKEREAIEDAITYVASGMNEKDAVTFKAYWAMMLTKYKNYRFFTRFTDDSQLYRLKWCDIEDTELVSNIDLVAHFVMKDKELKVNSMSEPCHIKATKNGRFCNGFPLIVSDVIGKPQKEENEKYPVLITAMPDDTYIVIDGNHRVINGETEARLLNPLAYIKSLISMYEIFMFLMDVSRCDYIKKVPMEDIIKKCDYYIKIIVATRNIR